MRTAKKHGSHPLKTIWNVVTWILVGAVVLVTIALVGVRLVGLRPYAVLSGSMEPTYKTGAVVYVKQVDYHTLKVGDPITFMVDDTTVATHRIVEIVPDEDDPSILRYRTKGDNNPTADGAPVHYKNVIGMPVFSLPYLGFVAHAIQNPPGNYLIIAGCALILFLALLPNVFASGKSASDTDEKAETDHT